MAGTAPAYFVALGAMLFAAASAVSLILAVSHLDPPDTTR